MISSETFLTTTTYQLYAFQGHYCDFFHIIGGTLAAMSDDRNEVTSGATGSRNCATMSKFVAFLWSWLMFLLDQSTNDDV